MIELLKSFLSTPGFDIKEETRISNLVHVITLTLFVTAIAGLILALATDRGNIQTIVISAIFLLLAVTSQLILRLGKIRLSGFMLVSVSWVATTLAVYSLGGISHPLVNIYFIVILTAALLLGGQTAVLISGMTIVTMLVFMFADQRGLIVHSHISLLAQWVVYSMLFVFTAILLYLVTHSLSQALRRSYKNQLALAKSNRKLATIQSTLEKQIAERTASLEQRSRYLQASAEITQAASSILDSGELVQRVVDLIQTRFDLYYVGLFLVDPSGEWAVLKAGTGEKGASLIERGHRIKIGAGMVGWSIANEQPRVAPAARDDAVRLDTPELPKTRSEAALPLRSRGLVIGALSVQSASAHAFDEDTISVLQTMADQVAIAIDNARLFAESQSALESLHQAYGDITRRAWDELFDTRSEFGFRFQGEDISIAKGEWQPEMIQAARSGQRLENRAEDALSLAIPIKVRNQIIGVLNFRKEGSGKQWTPEETTLLETLTEQLGVALESARLYEETQRRAERERLAGEISAKLRASNDPQMILQTAVQELRQALQANRAQVLLQPNRPPDTRRNGHDQEA